MDNDQGLGKLLRTSFVSAFDAKSRLVANEPHFWVLRTPLHRFDDAPIEVMLERLDNGRFVVHDGGLTLFYLQDYSVSLLGSGKGSAPFADYAKDLERFGVVVSKTTRRVEMTMTELDGSKIFDFAECLVALSFLVLKKQAGISPFHIKAWNEFQGLAHSLAKAFPTADMSQSITIPGSGSSSQPTVRHKWGVLLSQHRKRACVQYLAGDNWETLTRNMFMTVGVFDTANRLLNVDPANCIAVVSAPKEFQEPVRSNLTRMRPKSPYSSVLLGQRAKLFKLLSNRLEPGKAGPRRATSVYDTEARYVADHTSDRPLEDLNWAVTAGAWQETPDGMFSIEPAADERSAAAERYRLALFERPYSAVFGAVAAKGGATGAELRSLVPDAGLVPALHRLLEKGLIIESGKGYAVSAAAAPIARHLG